jgi:CBS-domain-containing membrane protein
MDRLHFFQGIVTALAIAFLTVGAALLHESMSSPGTQPWALLGGALLCSLALMFACLLWKEWVGRKYLD